MWVAAFHELLETYGVSVVMEAIQMLMDRAEAMTRARLSEIPDGSYTCVDYLDNDGVDLERRIAIQATVTIKGSDEMRYLLRIRQYSLRDGSGGAGCYRGGLGGTKMFEATYGDVLVSIRGERYFTQLWGLAGGQLAASAQAWVECADGSIEEILSKRVFTLHQGESLHVDTPGGGGYGDLLDSAPEAVRQDACDRRVTAQMAREQYGVVLQEPGQRVDQEATQGLRMALRAQRVEA